MRSRNKKLTNSDLLLTHLPVPFYSKESKLNEPNEFKWGIMHKADENIIYTQQVRKKKLRKVDI